ncbi:MAG: DNA-deoxyinosine glycosylase, partial [Rhodoferax sp.]
WDVLQSCVRHGSLDSAIQTGTRVANDFPTFFAAHPEIKCVCFNGAEAQTSFNRYVLPGLDSVKIQYIRLPSTSPAHAVGFAHKLAAWRAALVDQEQRLGR